MTAAVIPRLSVAAPAAAPPLRFGLFSAATVLENVEPHALSGVEYEAVCSTRVDPYPAPCRPGDEMSRAKTPDGTTSIVNASPFGVYAADACVLGRDANTARDQLRQRFLGGEQAAVERIIRTGELGNLPSLEQAPEVLDAGADTDLLDAIGLLEQ
ncbi:hypothetical protein, partial [Amycolatopsis sp.]|uniref:hypothetical protein n=1 Tax=Amycolatopsis sp. TaxID=37632 RepID=UPI002D8048C9